MKILFPQNPRKRILIPKTPRNKKMDSSLSPNPGEVKRVGNWKPYRRAWDACNGMTTVFFNHLAWINNTSSNYDWPLCCTRSQIWRIHFWNWWSHGVTQCESLTPINIQWELWPFSKFVTWPWGQLYIYFFTICSRRYILEMQNFFWIVIVSISCWNSYLDFPLGGVHILLWQDFANYWPPTPLIWHILPLRKVDIFGPPTHLFLSK